jgi:hypothetical protein
MKVNVLTSIQKATLLADLERAFTSGSAGDPQTFLARLLEEKTRFLEAAAHIRRASKPSCKSIKLLVALTASALALGGGYHYLRKKPPLTSLERKKDTTDQSRPEQGSEQASTNVTQRSITAPNQPSAPTSKIKETLSYSALAKIIKNEKLAIPIINTLVHSIIAPVSQNTTTPKQIAKLAQKNKVSADDLQRYFNKGLIFLYVQDALKNKKVTATDLKKECVIASLIPPVVKERLNSFLDNLNTLMR